MTAAICAALFAKDAADQTKRSADIAESSFASESRPWLLWGRFETYVGTGLVDESPVGNIIGIRPAFTNHGRSPAVRAMAAREVRELPFSERHTSPEFGDPPPKSGGVVVPPGTSASGADIQLHGEELRRFLARETVLFMWCQLCYHDMAHTTGAPPYQSVGVYAVWFDGWQTKEKGESARPNLFVRPVLNTAT